MKKKLLLKLAALLDVVPPAKFVMAHYAVSAEPVQGHPQCATAACALGWATTIPEIGLELVAHLGDRFAAIRFRGNTAWNVEAACAAFDLKVSDAMDLFYEGWTMTSTEKAEQIRAMVKAA